MTLSSFFELAGRPFTTGTRLRRVLNRLEGWAADRELRAEDNRRRELFWPQPTEKCPECDVVNPLAWMEGYEFEDGHIVRCCPDCHDFFDFLEGCSMYYWLNKKAGRRSGRAVR